jgi:aldehyde:ferredoxin oxidoreductase
MSGGYTGKIARVNLTTKEITTIATEKYEEYGGGHGMGSAIFFDLVGDQLPFPAFDPRNLVIMMASPFAGTHMPGSGRCEVQGLGPGLYPIEWFAHSNFGGRFTAQLKYAGWDGIVVEGASDKPVWINIINDQIKIEDANGVWGLDTWDAQQEISRRVVPKLKYGEWAELAGNHFTTQIPAVVCCGPAGEKKSRIACLLHGPGSQAALCGFGGVFGSKNLKAISALGSGSVPIADPKAFMDARLWFRQFQWDVDNPRDPQIFENGYSLIKGAPSGGNVSNSGGQNSIPSRAAACASCPRGCKQRLATADSNEAVCAGTMFASIGGGGMFGGGAKAGANAMPQPLSQKMTKQANDLMHRYGLGHWQLMAVRGYIDLLTRQGVIGKGKDIDPDLPASGSYAYYEALFRKISLREGKFGEWAAEAAARMAESLGRYKEDVHGGSLKLTYWGTQEHYSTQVQVDWGYGSLFGERDLMLHQMSNYPLHWMAQERSPYLTAEESSKLYSEAMIPYQDDRYIVDYGEGEKTGIYSDSKVRLVAWVKHYEKFWMGQGFCGWRWPQCITNNTADRRGATPQAEARFMNAATGKNLTFADYMAMGHKIYTLDRSIWMLQGRTRDLETFPDYIYDKPGGENILPMYIDGQWKYEGGRGRKLDRAKFEDFKTRFYKFEGYGENGIPTQETLTKMKMPKLAEVMKSKGKIG